MKNKYESLSPRKNRYDSSVISPKKYSESSIISPPKKKIFGKFTKKETRKNLSDISESETENYKVKDKKKLQFYKMLQKISSSMRSEKSDESDSESDSSNKRSDSNSEFSSESSEDYPKPKKVLNKNKK